ncbi:MAG: hypothetical protein M3337_06835 [Actinomycetota bacterium]|nr:hypothetical protein [Actinomycetota bacterium]
MLTVFGSQRRRFDRPLLVASLAIAAGLALIIWGITVSVTGDERRPLPDAIESVSPADGASQAPQQSRFEVDLVTGYEGTLAIDGVELPVVRLDELGGIDQEPGAQIDVPPVAVFEPGNATLSFTPSEGAPITSLGPGTHRATVTYWKTSEGRGEARSYNWQFTVV